MAENIKIEFIGWEDDFRYAEEKRRVTKHIEEIAKSKGFSFAQVQDMLIKNRYRAQGPWVDVHFQHKQEVNSETSAYVPARLWFTEDADMKSEPEFFEEVKGSTRAE
ncbi:hypothetical protein P153DRAFT_370298 [Dothidotthia symphoricarpi CBS 119687]|uniref:Uncharacterized protein n=1 Tax=Dothidotthia symphoricarpi CBS 119687 TaxID=1392245 RepID=A0A6A6A1D6_9PLEO|nr:uncharacterized protein P153DRAFT_370298 [Dothidotthia symphoricarpi CBS 119687]KAF2124974.1 hypothetical protein P153DRAFT_370298 [Dothidotthia symphoricarpi CBS 119687]